MLVRAKPRTAVLGWSDESNHQMGDSVSRIERKVVRFCSAVTIRRKVSGDETIKIDSHRERYLLNSEAKSHSGPNKPRIKRGSKT